MVGIAREVFDEHMKTPNQIARKREDVQISQADLLRVHQGSITEGGLRLNADVGIRYLEAWLGGNGCVPIHNLMEDAATAEICRAQLWQWIRHGAKLADGRVINAQLTSAMLWDEHSKIVEPLTEQSGTQRFEVAARMFESMLMETRFSDFLTLEAYRFID